ncbi:MAG: hypothetical protein KDK27_17905 [Leptospiraceae bacterium]|nr:hypothetical protein [Leptospiraceae bacterium]
MNSTKSIRLPRLVTGVAGPVIIFAAGFGAGYFTGHVTPPSDWLFGQFADRVVLAERMRNGDQEGYDRYAIPSIETMVLQLYDRGVLGKRASEQAKSFARRTLQLIEGASENSRIDKSMHGEVRSALEETLNAEK